MMSFLLSNSRCWLLACGEKVNISETMEDDYAHHIPEIADLTKPTVTEVDELTQQKMTAFENALIEAQWDSFLSATDDLAAQRGDEFFSVALIAAILAKARFKTIKELLDRGAILSDDTIHLLASKDNLRLTKLLLPYGLDLFFHRSDNKNALYYAVKLGKSVKMFDFLLDNGVAVQADVDLLSILIEKRTMDNIPYYCQRLIANGHKIKASHVSRLKQMKLYNQATYDLLAPVFGL
jgi:hypothetical protein